MSTPVDPHSAEPRPRRFSGLQVLALTSIVVLVTAGLTYWVVRTYIYPSEFDPVELSQKEQVQLDAKLRAIGVDPGTVRGGRGGSPHRSDTLPEGPLEPEPYFEDPGKREIGLSERELNALLAHNTDLARRLAIDLSDNLASAKLLIPVDPDFPIFGGRILRVNAGLQLEYRNERPVVMLRGVSLMGVPMPNAWLGNLKNVDLVEQFGGNPGFWKSFADGIDWMEIREGELRIKLRE